MLAGLNAVRVADFGNFIPILFVIYVIYAIFSSMAKAIKQAAQAQEAASATDTSVQPQLSAADVRLALQRRLAAAAAARAQAAAAQTAQSAAPLSRTPAVVPIPAPSTLTDFGTAGDALQVQSLPDGPLLTARPSVNLSMLLASLPLAAQAVVASAVIGPCAAHRGGGHDPEDW